MNLAAFQQSAFLQSLGWAIAYSIWQGGILWILYQVVGSAYRNASAKFKNNLSTTLLFGNFLWFVVTFFTKIIHSHDYLPGDTSNQLLYYTNADLVSGSTSIRNFISSVVITLPYLSLAYLLLLLIFAIKLVNSYRNTNFIKNNGLIKPGAEWKVFVEKVAYHINISKKIKIWFSTYVDVPATIGFLKPVILIPLASLNQLTADQLEAIILHEISHIKRNDYLVNLFVSLIETILFFNPFVVLLTNIIKKERENCCDDFVLQYQYDRHSYASALLVLEQSREQQFRLALAATSGRKQLLFRIMRIMEVKNSNEGLNYGQKLLALIVSTTIICSLAWLTPEKKTSLSGSKQIPVKLSRIVQPTPVTNAKDSSVPLLYIEPKRIISFLKPQILKGENTKDDSLATAGIIESNQADAPEDNTNADESAVNEVYNKVFAQKKPVLLSTVNDTNGKFLFSPDYFLSFLNVFENAHLNIDVNKLNADIESDNRVISSINWDNIKDQIKEGIEKINAPKFKMNFQNNRMEFAPLKKHLGEDGQNEFQFHGPTRVSGERNPRKRTWNVDSINISNSSVEGTGFSYSEDGENDLAFLSGAAEKGKKPVAVNPDDLQPRPGQYAYSFQSRTSPKVKLPPPPSICIDYKEGAILINGKKINLSEIKRSRAEKMVKTIISKNIKNTIEIESLDDN